MKMNLNAQTTAKKSEHWELHRAAIEVDGEAKAGKLYVYRGGQHLSARFIPDAWEQGFRYLPQKDKQDTTLSLDEIGELLGLAQIIGDDSSELSENFKAKDVSVFHLHQEVDVKKDKGHIVVTMYYPPADKSKKLKVPHTGKNQPVYDIRGWFWKTFPGCDFVIKED